MTDITPSDVAAFIAEQQGVGLKGWTIKGQMTVLSSIFTYSARHLGLVGVNPVSVLDRVERPSSDDERPKRVLTPPELRRLLDEIDEPYKLLFELAAETGCRLAEALPPVDRFSLPEAGSTARTMSAGAPLRIRECHHLDRSRSLRR